MKLWDRFRTALALLVLVTFGVAIADMFFSFSAIPWIGSPKFVLPVFTLAWLLAPAISRVFPWKRTKEF
jgi:hypothetical protein